MGGQVRDCGNDVQVTPNAETGASLRAKAPVPIQAALGRLMRQANREEVMQDRKCRVHIGWTQSGKDRWRYFNSIESAIEACNAVFNATGIVLTVEYAP